MRPPYSCGSDGGGDDTAPRVSADLDAGTVVMALPDFWSRELGHRACRAVKKCLSEHPRALIFDLRGMTGTNGATVTMLLNARRAGDKMTPAVTSSAPNGPLWEAAGHGLGLVDAATRVWGAIPTADGKMVWATLHAGAGHP